MGTSCFSRIREGGRPWLLGALLAAFLVPGPQAAPAATPLDVVRTSNEAVQAIFKRHPAVDAAVEKELFTVIDAVTDYPALASAAIDPFCPRMSPATCTTFKETFTRLLRISSIKKLGRYRADRFEYAGEEVDGATALVRTFAFYKEEKVPLDYRMARRGSSWVIVNYLVDEIDTVRNYRKQFTQLLGRETVEQVIERLNRKIASLEAEK